MDKVNNRLWDKNMALKVLTSSLLKVLRLLLLNKHSNHNNLLDTSPCPTVSIHTTSQTNIKIYTHRVVMDNLM